MIKARKDICDGQNYLKMITRFLAALLFASPLGAVEACEFQRSGTGMQTTRPFHMAGPWEVQWTLTGKIELFQLTALEQRNPDAPNFLASQVGNSPGSSYSPKGGDYFLQVNALGEGRWSLCIVSVP
jgi:hypothetical protein